MRGDEELLDEIDGDDRGLGVEAADLDVLFGRDAETEGLLAAEGGALGRELIELPEGRLTGLLRPVLGEVTVGRELGGAVIEGREAVERGAAGWRMFRWVGGALTPDPRFVRTVPGAVRVVVDLETLGRVCITDSGRGLSVGRLVTVGLAAASPLLRREPTRDPTDFRFPRVDVDRPVSIPRGDCSRFPPRTLLSGGTLRASRLVIVRTPRLGLWMSGRTALSLRAVRVSASGRIRTSRTVDFLSRGARAVLIPRFFCGSVTVNRSRPVRVSSLRTRSLARRVLSRFCDGPRRVRRGE